MRITHCLTRRTGGAGIAAERLHDALVANGMDSTMATLDGASFSRSPWPRLQRFRQKRKCRSWDQAFAPHQTQPGTYLHHHRSRWPLNQLLGGATDILHLHWISEGFDLPSIAAMKCPVVWTFHDVNTITGGCHYTEGCNRFTTGCGHCPMLRAPGSDDASRRCLTAKMAMTDFWKRVTIVAPSTWMAEEARRSPMLADTRICTIPYAIDTQLWKPRQRQPRARVRIGFSAHSLDERRKGLDLLMRALDGLTDKNDIELLIIGMGDQVPDIGIPVMKTGRLTKPQEVANNIGDCDLFICPSREDNLPNSIIEALACGVPVIAFAAGGMPDQVQDGINGLLVERESISGLQSAICTLVKNETLRQEMGSRARSDVLERYNPATVAATHKDLYHALLSSGSA